jgi:outer membrane protein TolC
VNRPIAVLLVACSAGLAAAEPATQDLTVEQAVERALRSSARLGQLRSLKDAADAGERAARAARLGQLDLSAGYTRYSDVPELVLALPGAPPRTIFPNLPDTWRSQARASLPLYTGGRLGAAIEAARAQGEAASLDADAGQADVVAEVRGAFWRLAEGLEATRVLRESIGAYESHLKDARNREELGLAARDEVLAVSVERDRAELARLKAELAGDAAEANLRRLIDAPGDTRLVPVASVPAPLPPDSEIEPLVVAALAARPEIAALQARARAAEAAARTVRAGRLPQASLSGQYDLARPNARILPFVDEWRGTWSLGINVGVTLDAGKTAASVAQAKAEAESLRKALEDVRGRLRLEVTTRALELRTALATLEVAERSLESARENVRVSRDRYREGVASSSDLLDAETAELRAGLDRTQSLAGAQVARANLDRALGR